ncbi:MAG: integration host factor subunit beta [Treponema sp.]|jgi:integration host factor subunit beta|nr:integration host factor subunit beta [Treponema sp.]
MTAKKYTKADILDAIYNKTDIEYNDIKRIMDFFIKEVKSALVERKTIELRGFGTFEVRVRKGRQRARNPRTGEIVSVETHGVAAFRPGRDLKQAVWAPDGKAPVKTIGKK